MKMRKGDQVIVMRGKGKGKIGKIIAINRSENRAVVEKINMVKRHQRPSPKMRQGGILEKEAPIQISNLMLYCTKCSRGIRVGYQMTEEKKKVRVCKRCKEALAA